MATPQPHPIHPTYFLQATKGVNWRDCVAPSNAGVQPPDMLHLYKNLAQLRWHRGCAWLFLMRRAKFTFSTCGNCPYQQLDLLAELAESWNGKLLSETQVRWGSCDIALRIARNVVNYARA